MIQVCTEFCDDPLNQTELLAVEQFFNQTKSNRAFAMYVPGPNYDFSHLYITEHGLIMKR